MLVFLCMLFHLCMLALLCMLVACCVCPVHVLTSAASAGPMAEKCYGIMGMQLIDHDHHDNCVLCSLCLPLQGSLHMGYEAWCAVL